MKVENMTNSNGRSVPNQFVIEEEGRGALGNFVLRRTFQSYGSVIAIVTEWLDGKIDTVLDEKFWDHSTTTGKYRNLFLDETKRDTERKIKNGTYRLGDLNKSK